MNYTLVNREQMGYLYKGNIMRCALISFAFICGAAVGFTLISNSNSSAQSLDYYKAQMKYGEASVAYSKAKDMWATEKDRYQSTDKAQTDLITRFDSVKAKMTQNDKTTCDESLLIAKYNLKSAGENVNTSYQFKIIAGDQIINAALLIEIKEYITAYNVAVSALDCSNSSIGKSTLAKTNIDSVLMEHQQMDTIIKKYEM